MQGKLRDGKVDFATLSERERDVLLLLADGLANDAIASSLGVSVRTVQSHVSSLLSKTGCSNRTQLAVRAIRDGAV